MTNGEEKKRSYVILRFDGLLLHTKPVTEDEARWLFWDAYSAEFIGREAKIRYLEEWGNVLDASEYLERLPPEIRRVIFYVISYDPSSPIEGFKKALSRLLRLKGLSPEDRRLVREFADRVGDFLREPIEPKPIGPQPVRYLEMEGRHAIFVGCCDDAVGLDSNVYGVEPRPEWYAYTRDMYVRGAARGVSVFKDSFWLWDQSISYTGIGGFTRAVAVRRDVDDKEVVAALTNDEVAAEFLKQYGDDFRELLREHEAEMASRGYDDVVRKAKLVLATAQLLTASRHSEEGVPA